jgi:hypothetical protein
MRRLLTLLVGLLCFLPPGSIAEQPLQVKTLAEKVVTELPAGVLYWKIENFGTVDQAQAAARPYSLVAESAGKIWLFTLGAADAAASPTATRVARVGPIGRVNARRYRLRINDASGPPGSVTAVHSHPGSEAFLVLDGEQSIKGAHGIMRVSAGHTEPGHGADQAMQVSNSGLVDLHALVMFVVDADRPFTSPATLP